MAKKDRISALAAAGWGIWVAYFVAGWLSLAFLAYGFALNQYNADKNRAPGLVISDEVESRWSWGLGVVGDVCFRLKQNRVGWFCVPQSYLVAGNGAPGNLFFQLSPGTPVKLKAQAGRVTELTAYPDLPEQRKALVVYGYAIGKVQEDMRGSDSGSGFIFLAFLWIPAVWATRRFALPRLKLRKS